ncbi:MAG: hypothetical protein MI802_24780 [Desulfobacterales bacterium]|nr:hypothetical protein [Desulfobacterales bacterium]
MKKKDCFVYVLYCLMFTVIQTGFCLAEGRMLLKPHIEVGWEKNNNFHKSETNEKEVDTYYVKPGLEFGYTTEKSTVSLDYWFNVLRYDDRDDE